MNPLPNQCNLLIVKNPSSQDAHARACIIPKHAAGHQEESRVHPTAHEKGKGAVPPPLHTVPLQATAYSMCGVMAVARVL
jgi:hypothetical protein